MPGKTTAGSRIGHVLAALPNNGTVPAFPRTIPVRDARHALTCVTEMLTTVGRPEFYPALAAELCSLFGCGRYLAMCYSRNAKPVFLFNRSFARPASDIYLDSLYEHDPLYRTVMDGEPGRVITLRSLNGAFRLSRYRAALLRHAHIFDELAIMLPAPDGAAIAVCFNQDAGSFDPSVVRMAESMYPVLKQANRLHLERASLTDEFGQQLLARRDDRNAPRCSDQRELIKEFQGIRRLSTQECKVLTLTMDGLDNRSIATRLNLAFGTVKNYKRRLYQKLGVSSAGA